MKKTLMTGVLGAAALFSVASGASADTLSDVKAKGFLQCGVNTGLLGFASPNDKGEWSGFDVDYCRAVASAIFGDPTKVKFTPLNAKERFTALQSGEVDVLIRNTTWTISRDTALGLDFAGINYFDGQGFMINSKKLSGINSALQLSGASICVQAGTTTELNMADYFRANKMGGKYLKIYTISRFLGRNPLQRRSCRNQLEYGIITQLIQFVKFDYHPRWAMPRATPDRNQTRGIALSPSKEKIIFRVAI